MVSIRGIIGALSCVFNTVGMYPLTQIYQIEEDKRRGGKLLLHSIDKQTDITTAIALGVDGSFKFSLFFLSSSGILVSILLILFYSLWKGVVVLIYFGLLMRSLVYLWRIFYKSTVLQVYTYISRVCMLNSLATILFLGSDLLFGL